VLDAQQLLFHDEKIAPDAIDNPNLESIVESRRASALADEEEFVFLEKPPSR
jgi:hypothetical protein